MGKFSHPPSTPLTKLGSRLNSHFLNELKPAKDSEYISDREMDLGIHWEVFILELKREDLEYFFADSCFNDKFLALRMHGISVL